MASKDRLIGSNASVASVGGTSILGIYDSAELRFERPMTEVTAIKDTDGPHFLPTHGNSFVGHTVTFRKKIDTISIFSAATLLTAGTVAWAFTEGASGAAISGSGYVENVSNSAADGPQTEEVTIRGEGIHTRA